MKKETENLKKQLPAILNVKSNSLPKAKTQSQKKELDQFTTAK